MNDSSRATRALLAASAILFLSIGTRQGFGLFMGPAMAIMSRQQFSVAIATQYLVWGIVVAVSGVLSAKVGVRRIVVTGCACYAGGLFGSSFATGFPLFWLCAGVLVGVGLGAASFGILDGVVARSAPAERRGLAMGTFGASAALGQMTMLVFTHATIDHLGWQEALRWHALAVTPIAVAAFLIPHEFAAPQPTGLPNDRATGVLRQPAFWLVAVPLSFAGLQVMSTMTHLPAFVHDKGWPAEVAAHALLALSMTPFAGSLACGWVCDRAPPLLVLSAVYLLRAAFAFTLAWAPLGPTAFVISCGLFGFVWMAHLPTTSTVVARWWGPGRVAAVFSVAFLLHQSGGFTGTWAAAAIRDASQSYAPMWALCGALSGLGSVLVLLGAALGARGRSPRIA